MKQIYPDLWQTSTERTVPGSEDAVSNAYLLIRDDGNTLFYGTGREAVGSADDGVDLDHIEELGGVKRQLIGHWHEASASIAKVKRRFDAEIICHAREAPMLENVGGVRPDHTFWERSVIAGALEAIPTPGHTVGSACYLYHSPGGNSSCSLATQLFQAREAGWLVHLRTTHNSQRSSEVSIRSAR